MYAYMCGDMRGARVPGGFCFYRPTEQDQSEAAQSRTGGSPRARQTRVKGYYKMYRYVKGVWECGKCKPMKHCQKLIGQAFTG